MSHRYKIVQGSQSAHCCFGYTIVDTTTVLTGYKDDYEEICECFELQQAELICDALNSRG
jgi:hypothetical protein